MEFETVDKMAMTTLRKGTWKPLFKSRYNNNYFDFTKREEYEKNLRKRIFSNVSDSQNVVVSPNTYPFNFDPEITQYVVWIRNLENDPGIENIVKNIESMHPEKDYFVYINNMNGRSIKSIQHYHAMIKPVSQPYHLEKIIVFHRHGNRSPIYKLPNFEKMLGSNDFSNDFDPSLLPSGYYNATKFGSDLKKIYSLDENFITDSIFVSSPFKRCRDTSKAIIHGLGLTVDTEIYDSDKLKIEILDTTKKVHLYTNMFEPIYEEYIDLMTELENIFGIDNKYSNNINSYEDKIYALTYIYDYHSTLQCYRDLGIEIDQFVNKQLQQSLENANMKVYNMLCHAYQLILSKNMQELLSFANHFEHKLVMCSTHDTIVFVMAKYLANLKNINYDYELPDYLSNIRIEKWSDGTVRYFYNNWFIGSNLLLT
ncbi:putative ORFan [Tupanvirus deep ocean]|uniref:ORFan n=2 Tax=Tupanvirus TaxID=2094720 RepID=A0AC62AA18_9VIRU|nr:putative ORFan [Tupanvirus deep ocean]QKU34604.1 putative ORFan [Tupanvirus deep ocean]